jgi:hypothetical protein
MQNSEIVEIKYIGFSEPWKVKTMRVPAAEAEKARKEIRESQTIGLAPEDEE